VWFLLLGFFVGFVLARVLLGRKQWALGQAAAYASVEASLVSKMAATQTAAQQVKVSVGNGYSLPDRSESSELALDHRGLQHGVGALRRKAIDDVERPISGVPARPGVALRPGLSDHFERQPRSEYVLPDVYPTVAAGVADRTSSGDWVGLDRVQSTPGNGDLSDQYVGRNVHDDDFDHDDVFDDDDNVTGAYFHHVHDDDAPTANNNDDSPGRS
jgi:hypothetical protein